MKTLGLSAKRLLAVVALLGCASVAMAQTITADGLLVDEIEGALDLNGDGFPDFLDQNNNGTIEPDELRIILSKLVVDGVLDGTFPTGVDGFRDAGLRSPNIPDCSAAIQCLDTANPPPSVRSGLNTGKLTVFYLPDSDGFIDPADPNMTDDSVIYVGMDIFNGPAGTVIGVDPASPGAMEGVNFWRLDIVDSDGDGMFCDEGVLGSNPIGLPFDVDADGLPAVTGRWSGLPCPFNAGLGQVQPADNDAEFYRMDMDVCGGPTPFFGRLRLDSIKQSGDIDFTPNFPSVTTVPGFFRSWPNPTDTPNVSDLIGLGARDVEFVIRHPDTLVQRHPMFSGFPYEINRLRIAEGRIDTGSDADGDNAAEDVIIVPFDLEVPDIEVTKQVRCVSDDPNSGIDPSIFFNSVSALPGSTVQFRIVVNNRGNVPLAVVLDDTLSGLGTFIDPIPGSLQVTLTRPSDGLMNIPINAGNAFSQTPPLNPLFFDGPAPGEQGFLASLDGTEICLGVLNGVDVCGKMDPVLGDTVVILFDALIRGDAPACPPEPNDVRNAVTAIGDPAVIRDANGVITDPCPDPTRDDNRIIAIDTAGLDDTLRELYPEMTGGSTLGIPRGQGDDNVVYVNVLCREVEFVKEVGGLPTAPNDFRNDDRGDMPLNIPNIFPVDVTYRYTATNTGETAEAFTIADQNLCADVAATAGVDFVAGLCPLCPTGSVAGVLAPAGEVGDTFTTQCVVRFSNSVALRNFLNLDNNRSPCTSDPADGDAADCYKNCSAFTSNAEPSPDICPIGDLPINIPSEATICNFVCMIDVTKTVVCLDNCTNRIPVGTPTSDTLNVLPGSCVRFQVNVLNTGDMPVCRLRITDTMLESGCLSIVPGTTQFRIGATPCAVPPMFNTNGTPFVFNPTTCGVGLQPGATLIITFIAQVATDADPNCLLSNSVFVEGAAPVDCAANSQNPTFTCFDDDEVDLDLKVCDIECTKEYSRFRWDRNANCVLDAGEAFEPFTDPNVLRDVVFPVEVELEVTATNTGECALSVTASDAALLADIAPANDGLTIVSCQLGGAARQILPGASSTWTCVIRIDTAAAARVLAGRDTDGDPTKYTNEATVVGVPISTTGFPLCVPNPLPGDLNVMSTCMAMFRVPPPCQITVDKGVRCLGDTGPFADSEEAIPGATLEFQFSVTNTGTVNIPRVCLDDLLGCPWFVPGSVTAQIRQVDTTLVNVTASFAAFAPDGVARCFKFASRPAAPWIAPGETLLITFRATVPTDVLPANRLCVNTVEVEAFSEACDPGQVGVAITPCSVGNADARINVLFPAITCLKQVAADFNNDGTPDTPFSDTLNLPGATTFPVSLVYKYTVNNTGETPLTNVQFCCDGFVQQVLNAGAGITFGPCALCNGGCNGVNDDCAMLPDLAVGGMAMAQCTINIPSEAAFQALANADGDQNEGCFDIDGRAQAMVDSSTICVTNADTNVRSAVPCSVQVCFVRCMLEVTKEVRCLSNCTSRVPAGPFEPDLLRTVPGAAVQYRVTINNVGMVNVCALRIRDLIDAGLDCDPTSFVFQVMRNGTDPICTIPGLALDDTPLDVLISSVCPGVTALTPGDSLVITWVCCVPTDATPQTINNRVIVECASECDPTPDFCCEVTDDVDVEILEVGLVCTKEYTEFRSDQNADCVLDEAFEPFTGINELVDETFPIELKLEICAENTGDVPLSVTVNDPNLLADIAATPGVSVLAGCQLGTTRTVAAGATECWTCTIRIDTAAAARALALRDGDGVSDVYKNVATATGVAISDPANGLCAPNPPPADAIVRTMCEAEFRVPPPCVISVDKGVRCVDDPASTFLDSIEALPGARLTFEIRITNDGTVNIPRVCISDRLTCSSWFIAGSVAADIDGDDVTANFGLFVPSTTGTERCFTFAARPAAPWIAPGETLTVLFDVRVPVGFDGTGSTVDCRNTVNVKGFTEGCAPGQVSVTLVPCNAGPAEVTIDVRTPSIMCDKLVAVDLGNNGVLDTPARRMLDLQNPQFPMRLVYTYDVVNDGEVPLTNVCLTDNTLANAAAASPDVSIIAAQCDLDMGAGCAGAGNRAALIGGLAPGQTVTLTCALLVNSVAGFEAIANLPGDQVCFENRATVRGTPDAGQICALPPILDVTSTCVAEVCIEAAECPPITAALFTIWNQNEVPYTPPLEYCLNAWDCFRVLDASFLFGADVLNTAKAKARIDGRDLDSCSPDSIDAPLLGVMKQVITFVNGPAAGQIAMGGDTLIGMGQEFGYFEYDLPIPGQGLTGGAGADAVRADPESIGAGIQDSTTRPYIVLEGEEGNVGVGTPQEPSVRPQTGTTGQKGSLLVLPKIEVKWDAGNNLIQDTFVTLTNDYPAPVYVKIFLVNGDPRLCNAVDVVIRLTPDQPSYWSSATGEPGPGLPATRLRRFSDLGPGEPDNDPENPGGRKVEGYLVAFAVDAVSGEEINWNHLNAVATLVNYSQAEAWEYPAWSFRAIYGQTGGRLNPLHPGRLMLDGQEYAWAPDILLMNFFPTGEFADAIGNVVFMDTELTLLAAKRNLSSLGTDGLPGGGVGGGDLSTDDDSSDGDRPTRRQRSDHEAEDGEEPTGNP